MALTDEELIAQARTGQKGAEEELAQRYIRLVRICSRPFFLSGGDSEDRYRDQTFRRARDCGGNNLLPYA